MQRARIILEAAGFLLPVDLSSSLLPPNLNSSPPLQHAAVPAVHALPAGLQTGQAAVQGGVYTSGEEEEEGLPVQHAAVSGVEQAVTEGTSCFRSQMPLSHSTNSHTSRVINPCCHGSVLVSYCTFAICSVRTRCTVRPTDLLCNVSQQQQQQQQRPVHAFRCTTVPWQVSAASHSVSVLSAIWSQAITQKLTVYVCVCA